MKEKKICTDSEQKKGDCLLKIGILLCLSAVIGVCIWLQKLSVSEEGRIFPVYINEVLASNTAYPNEDGLCCDYIELYNSADYAVDLTGFQLGDIAGAGRYAFPAGTVMEGDSYLVVYFRKEMDDPRYAPFSISRSGGESYCLVGSNRAIVDQVLTVPADTDQAMIRTDLDQWQLSSVLTPGFANDSSAGSQADILNTELSALRISEYSSAANGYHRESGRMCDWVEIQNTGTKPLDLSGFILSDNAGNDKYRFPQDSILEPGGFRIVFCSDDLAAADVAPFSLSQGGTEQLTLKNQQGNIIELLRTLPMTGGSAMLQEDGSWQVSTEPSPGYPNTESGYRDYLQSIGGLPGTLAITEVMAGAQAILPDSEGNFPDWIEITNQSSKAVNLEGWFLSDDVKNLQKWQFPSAEIQPGQQMIVFCSGGQHTADDLYADFSLSAGGETLTLSTYSGAVVHQVSYQDTHKYAAWQFASDGTDPAETMLPTPGYPNTAEGYEQFSAAQGAAGPIAIWEVMTNNDWYLPQALGKCYDWVEIRNISQETISLGGLTLTDDPDIRDMYALPDETLEPGASVVIMLSGDESLSGSYAHAGFSLNTLADQLMLYQADGSLLDFVFIRDVPLGMSYGRQTESDGFYYMEPTPENPNHAGYRLISAMPTSQYEPGVYSGEDGFDVALSAEGTIYYTTDGSDPTVNSARYQQPVSFDSTGVLRAISVEDGKYPSDIYTVTFVVGEPHTLPVVSLVTDPDHLWGPDGVYHNGDITMGDIKFPAHVSYSGQDGTFSKGCEMSLHGATTVIAFQKKSFCVRFKDEYDGPLSYDVFEDGDVTAFRSLLIRTAHESTFSTQMHDTMIGQVAAENCDTLLTQKYKYVSLYLNGEYWGLYALREHHSPQHYGSYMHLPSDTVTVVRYCTDQENALSEIFSYCQYNDFSSPEVYSQVCRVLDVTSFADWIIMQSYMNNCDINGNMRYYYSPADGLWRCGLVDLDLGMTDDSYDFDGVADTWHHGRIVTALLANETFQDLIARRLAELLSGPMSDENMVARVQAMADEIRPETALEAQRWGTPVDGWQGFVDQMIAFCSRRSGQMIDGLCEVVGFTEEEKLFYFGNLLK